MGSMAGTLPQPWWSRNDAVMVAGEDWRREVVARTMQPTHAWLWLHPGSRAGAATGDRAAGSAPQAGVSPPSGRV
jgi:hypothetical protein